jgi:drug/metabolite transporter (DMT)-like permease
MKQYPYLGLGISISSVSFAAIIIVSLNELGTPPLTISFYRILFTTILIIPIILYHKNIRYELRTIPLKTFSMLLAIGVILGAHFALWITSLTLTSVASSVILVTAHPILVGPLAFYFLKEKLSTIHIIGIIISVCGVIILVYGNYGWSPSSLNSLEGNLLAMLGGICAGLYILGGRTIRKTLSTTTYAFVVYSVATLTLFITCIGLQTPLTTLTPKEYELILLMAFIAGILGHTLYNWSLKYIRASVASVALLGEPIGSSLLAFALPWIHQIPTTFTIIGGGIILIGIYLTSRNQTHHLDDL